ncbi:type I restriction-modification system, specificity subunit S HsdS [Psychroflexus torquis ATCC 700755]|uniref:Type I restriction-modification system, specificity subunit S HsdS n=1 Tax=Psychroflexus torquis (strain ATCC 700755 / CIP 106069 / ACAM 623) TaxID=313595 RepID=K4IJ00_PSYTT|nr:restriction endonuclease subunit S [Psychroflexus torquis]AFU70512.1 type I restriction-modification system, specificity subunit S HsdS [Psychroflexus torquis ATCC 700755]
MSKEMTTLGESCKFFNGKAHEKDIDVEGAFVVVNSKFISRDGKVRKNTRKQMFPLFEEDIVMVMSDVPNGKALAKCYIIEENNKYSLNQRICAIRTTEFNIGFLYYQLNRHSYFLAFNNGENQSNLRKGDILNCPLWKPPLSEQKQIVAILDKAFTAIEQAKANIEKNIVNAKELFQSKLNAIFSQKGDGWEERQIKDITTKIGSGATPRGGQSSYKESGISLIRSMNVHDDGFRDKKLAFIDDEQANKLSNVTIEENDVLLNITGASVARCCIVDKHFLPARVNQHVSIIRLKEGIMSNKFLHFALTSKETKSLLLGIGEQGATRQAITKVQIENFKIAFPSIIEA